MYPGRLITTILMAFALAAALMPAACGDEGDPAEVVQQVFAAYNARDFDRVYDLSSSELQEKSGGRDKAVALMATSWPEGTEVLELEVKTLSIEGDAATVEWSGIITTPELPDEPGGATVRLVRQDGRWLLAP